MNKGRVFACADLHGRLDLYKKIKEFLNPEDKVYFLGDACDRGPDSWETVKAITRDSQFIYLMGNHEDMMINSMRGWYMDGPTSYEDYYLWLSNGGGVTEESLMKESGHDIEIWMNRLAKLPVYEVYTNRDGKVIYLSHAGFTPALPKSTRDLVWDRYHIMEGWPEDCDEMIVVHGHTPTMLMSRYDPWGIVNDEDREAIFAGKQKNPAKGAVWYADGHKVNIDCGSVWTGKTVLLDLDTFEQHIFTIDESEEK